MSSTKQFHSFAKANLQIAEAHKQNLESMTVYNDTLKYKVESSSRFSVCIEICYQVVNALLDIEKQSDADTKKVVS
eukprot:747950-Hanusia_phi.AAC.2